MSAISKGLEGDDQPSNASPRPDIIRQHCPRCRFPDLYRVSEAILQCNDCGLAFNVDEAIVGVDPAI